MNSINNHIHQPSIQQNDTAFTAKATNETLKPDTAHSTLSIEKPSNQSSNIIVNISTEAQEKLAQEQKALGQELVKQQHSKKSDEAEETEVSETELLDKIIADIQEKIKEVQQEIKALNGKNSEEAEAQRKALNAELASLNASLINVMNNKLDTIESA